MRMRGWQTCAVCVLAAACGHETIAERIAEHDRVRQSWVQTARFVGLEWSRRAIPDAFAERTLARTREELQSEERKLEADRLPDTERERLRASLEGAIAFADSLRHQLSSSDASSVARLVERAPAPSSDSLLRRAELR
ncbi:MAG TPA: hypothetical protein VGO46_13045 [Gemmatimonadaceae bacterium]|nr:hypothetical protein [Gemmatimonadaceae bacterium]